MQVCHWYFVLSDFTGSWRLQCCHKNHHEPCFLTDRSLESIDVTGRTMHCITSLHWSTHFQPSKALSAHMTLYTHMRWPCSSIKLLTSTNISVLPATNCDSAVAWASHETDLTMKSVGCLCYCCLSLLVLSVPGIVVCLCYCCMSLLLLSASHMNMTHDERGATGLIQSPHCCWYWTRHLMLL